MSKNCRGLQMRLLQQDPLAAADNEHLDHCDECSEYRQVLARALDHIDDCEPPSHVDRAILDYARQSVSRPTPLPMVFYVKVLASVAALVLCVLVGARIYRQLNTDPQESPTEIAAEQAPITGVPKIAPQEAPSAIVKSEAGELPEVVAEFDWEDDPIEAELAGIEAEFMLFTIDDETAELVSKAYDGKAAE